MDNTLTPITQPFLLGEIETIRVSLKSPLASEQSASAHRLNRLINQIYESLEVYDGQTTVIQAANCLLKADECVNQDRIPEALHLLNNARNALLENATNVMRF